MNTLRSLGLAALFALPTLGCDFTEADIRSWPSVSKGTERLAGYYVDTSRPAALRSVAARVLYDNGQLGQIMGVVRHTTEADRQTLLPDLAGHVGGLLGTATDPGDLNRAVELGFYLLEFHAEMSAETRAPLVDALAKWAMANLGQVISPAPRRTPEDLLLATWLVDAERVRPKVFAWFEAAQSDKQIGAMADLLRGLKQADVQQAVAKALLTRAKKAHPKLSVDLVDAMLRNNNETLLRYLVASVADVRIEHGVRAIAWNEGARRLKAKGVPQYFGLLRMNDPANGNDARYLALDAVVEHGGVEMLAKALRALPKDGDWPTEGDEFRAQVRVFCDGQVARHKVAARPVLVELIDDANWVARAYAMECILRLYPDEAPELLVDLLDDETVLKGFTESGEPTTFGDVVRSLRNADE